MGSFVNFFDGYTSSSAPTAVDANTLINFANDAAFEAAVPGAPQAGNIYFNTTDNEPKYYDGTQWVSISSGAGDSNFLISYISDSAFETANGVPPYSGKTGIYYNTTDDVIRFYNVDAAAWQNIGGETVLRQEDLGFGDGVVVSYPLSFAPASPESVQVFLDGLMYEKSNYTITGSNLIFNTAPANTTQIYVSYLTTGTQTATLVPIAGSYIVENRTVSFAEETAKSLTLTATPTNTNEVIIQIVDGVNLRNGTDYSISGTTMSWSGLGLDGILAAGDELTIWFFT